MAGDRKLIQRMIGTLVVLLSVACGPIFRSTPPSAAWQSTVDELNALQSDLEIPEHFEDENAARTGEEFDINEYFAILDRLSMEPGYELDYVYCYDGMGGYPRLYARPEEQPRYVTCAEYEEGQSYLEYIRIDDTEEGFFQFVVMHVVGRQFYLYWHANYDDDVIICNREALEKMLERIEQPKDRFSAAQRRAALAIDPAPVVEMGDEVVTVKIVVFSQWAGFERGTFEIGRDFPHEILESEYETLVEHDSGIMF